MISAIARSSANRAEETGFKLFLRCMCRGLVDVAAAVTIKHLSWFRSKVSGAWLGIECSHLLR